MASADLLKRYGYTAAEVCPVYYGNQSLIRLKELTGGHQVLVVSDESCMRAGSAALSVIPVCDTVIFEEGIEPDEEATSQVRRNLLECSMIVAIGSKTVNDIAKYAAFREDIPFVSVITAPSGGSYISEYADLYLNKNKTSVKCRRPEAVIADLGILLKAPALLKLAGLGTLMCKAGESIERAMGALVYRAAFQGEGGDDESAEPLLFPELKAAEICFRDLSKHSLNSEKGVAAVLGANLAVQSFLENAPGSAGFRGAGKLLSDFFQSVCFCRHGGKRGIEGETLGLGAAVVKQLTIPLGLRIRSQLLVKPSFSFKVWEKKIESVFPSWAAEKIIESEKRLGYNAAENRQKRVSAVYAQATEIVKRLDLYNLFDPWLLLYEKEGGITSYKKLGLTLQELKHAILFGKDMASGFSLLQLASDLNVLTEFATGLNQKNENYV